MSLKSATINLELVAFDTRHRTGTLPVPLMRVTERGLSHVREGLILK